jgi:AP-1 complex subunit gamma-1
VVNQYIVTAAMKLSTRLTEPAQLERLRRLLLSYQTNLDVEIQQRAVEYSNLFTYDQVRRGVLEKMPPPEIREEQRVLGEATKKPSKTLSKKKKPSQMSEQDMLLDLMGDTNMPIGDSTSPTNGSQNNADLLADILGGGDAPPQTSSPPAAQSQVSSIMDLFNTNNNGSPAPAPAFSSPPAASADLFGGLGGMSSPPPQSVSSPPLNQQPQGHEAYNKSGLQIFFQTKRDASAVQVLARFKNTSPVVQLSGVSLQAAVPKSQRLQLQAISSSELAPGQGATQQMRVQSVQGVSAFYLLP